MYQIAFRMKEKRKQDQTGVKRKTNDTRKVRQHAHGNKGVILAKGMVIVMRMVMVMGILMMTVMVMVMVMVMGMGMVMVMRMRRGWG